jgi:hypothetical protein
MRRSLVPLALLLAAALPSVGRAAPDPELAKKALAVLDANCARCHGKDGPGEGGMNYVLDPQQLAARKKIVPGRDDLFADPTRGAAREDLDSVSRPAGPTPPRGVAASFSCSEGEKAYEDDKLGHGVFFHFVIEKLKRAAEEDKDEVTLLDLGADVTRRVGGVGAHAAGRPRLPAGQGVRGAEGLRQGRRSRRPSGRNNCPFPP